MVSGMVIAARTLPKQALHQRQVAQQPRAAVAPHHFVHRAAEVDVHHVEAQVLADAGGVGHHLRVGAEKLGARWGARPARRPGTAGCGVGLRAPREAATPWELVNSVMSSPQPPRSRMKRRKTVSVTPAMGASTVAGAMATPPIWKRAGKRLHGASISLLFYFNRV